jgi:hypothetical protein
VVVRRALLSLGVVIVGVAAADLGARVALGRDLVALAARPSNATPRPPPPSRRDAPLFASLETSRYSISWLVPPSCTPDATCVVRVTLEPTPDRYLPTAPFAFRAKQSPGFSFEGTRFDAKERTASRAVIEIPLHVVGSGPHTLEGGLRVFTCKGDECRMEEQPMTIPLS